MMIYHFYLFHASFCEIKKLKMWNLIRSFNMRPTCSELVLTDKLNNKITLDP